MKAKHRQISHMMTMTTHTHINKRIDDIRKSRSARMLKIFVRRTDKIDLITLLILPSPIWPFYFMYRDELKRKLRNIKSNERKRK